MPLMPVPMLMGRDQSFLDSRNVTRATDLVRRDTRLLDRARDITSGRNLSKRADMMGLRQDSNFNEFLSITTGFDLQKREKRDQGLECIINC